MLQSFFQHPLVPTAAVTRHYNGNTIPAQAQPPLPAEMHRQLENCGCVPLQELPTPPRAPAANSDLTSAMFIFLPANEMLFYVYHKENRVICLQINISPRTEVNI